MSTQLVPHWIIVNNETSSIWLKPFIDENECKKVFEENKDKFLKFGWKIERRESYRKVDDGEIALNRLVDKAKGANNYFDKI